MVIGIDASRANQLHRRGTEWYSFFLIKELASFIGPEHRVVLYTAEPLREDLKKGLPSHFQERVLLWPPKFLWTLLRLSIEMLISPPDLLFVPAHTFPLIQPKKTVVTIHDIGFERMRELYNLGSIGSQQPLLSKIFYYATKICTLGKYSNNELDYHRWALRFAIKHAHHIITISDFSRRELKDVFGLLEQKITRIYQGYDPSLKNITDQKQLSSVKQKYHISKPYVFYLGSLELKKNIPQLIEAWSILKNRFDLPHILVLGGKAGFGYEEVRQNIERFDLSSDVFEIGYVSPDDVAALYSGATAAVLPSLYEGFGIPVLEAFACQAPLVCSSAASLPEIAGDGAAYFDPHDPQDMAGVIASVLHSTEKQTELIRKGKERLENFSWKTCAQETWKVLQNVLV